jgi:capsular polysaccharide biosynthesis protein
VKTPTVRRVAVALLAGLIFAGVGAAYEKRRPKVFQSAATMVIDQPNAIVEAGGEGVILKLNQLRVKYGTLMRTLALIEPVAKKLNLPIGAVARAIGVVVPGQSLVMGITGRTGSPTQSAAIANGMADELVDYLKSEQDAAPVKIPPDKRIIFKVVARAQPGFKVSPTDQRVLAVGAIGGVIALLVFYLGMPLLGELRRRP